MENEREGALSVFGTVTKIKSSYILTCSTLMLSSLFVLCAPLTPKMQMTYKVANEMHRVVRIDLLSDEQFSWSLLPLHPTIVHRALH